MYLPKHTGSGSGLSLILNVEYYEYMKGPQNDTGVKVEILSFQFVKVAISWGPGRSLLFHNYTSGKTTV